MRLRAPFRTSMPPVLKYKLPGTWNNILKLTPRATTASFQTSVHIGRHRMPSRSPKYHQLNSSRHFQHPAFRSRRFGAGGVLKLVFVICLMVAAIKKSISWAKATGTEIESQGVGKGVKNRMWAIFWRILCMYKLVSEVLLVSDMVHNVNWQLNTTTKWRDFVSDI